MMDEGRDWGATPAWLYTLEFGQERPVGGTRRDPRVTTCNGRIKEIVRELGPARERNG